MARAKRIGREEDHSRHQTIEILACFRLSEIGAKIGK
jgi:hypothetical protein